jgi:hypothetical protein
MSSWEFAPNITRLTISASGVATQLESGLPVRIWGFIISNTGTGSATTVSVQDMDGTDIFDWRPGSGGSVAYDTKFIADNGFQFIATGAGATDMECTVFHSHPGS